MIESNKLQKIDIGLHHLCSGIAAERRKYTSALAIGQSANDTTTIWTNERKTRTLAYGFLRLH